MQSRINLITLAVDELERALVFYRDGLGLDSPGVVGTDFPGDDESPAGAVAMFELDGGSFWQCGRGPSWRRTRAFRSRARRLVSSVSARSSPARKRWMLSSPRRRRPVRPSPTSRTIERGGSTRATSATRTVTS